MIFLELRDCCVPYHRARVLTERQKPNLKPPITTVQQALDYRRRLEALESNVTFLMSLYLHPTITPETVRFAKRAGIRGIKSYPAGVTKKIPLRAWSTMLPFTKSLEKRKSKI